MQIYSNKLTQHLKQTLAPVYLIAGDDILLKNEAADEVRKAAGQQGFKERERFYYETGFDWMSWSDNCNAMSLFANQRLIELTLNTSKIGAIGSEAIVRYCENLPADTVLLILAPRIEGKAKWVKSATSTGVFVPIYPLDKKQLAPWLVQRAKSKKLKLLYDAAELLADRVEGNLVAAAQELDKLALLLPEKSTVDIQTVGRAVADSARFSAFSMLDRAIDGDALGACRALRHLKEEGNEPPAIIGAIAHQLRTLVQLKEYQANNKLSEGFKSLRIINKRQSPLANSLANLSSSTLNNFVRLASSADIDSKSANKAASWALMEMILLGLAGKPLPTQYAHL